MKKLATILAAAGVMLTGSPATAAITTCPSFTKNISNVLCINKSPKFDKRVDLTGQIYCSTTNNGTPDGTIQVDNYVKLFGYSFWAGSCKTDCSNFPSQWPVLTLPQYADVIGGLC